MDPRLVFGFWTWSTWWLWRRRHRDTQPSSAHRRRLRPQERTFASGGGNPSLLAVRRMPCAQLAGYRMRARRRRSAPPQVTGA